MKDQIIILRDTLGAAHSTLHAMQRALPQMLKDGTADFCALDQLASYVLLEISRAQDAIDEMECGTAEGPRGAACGKVE